MVAPRRCLIALLVVILLSSGSVTLYAHQDPCHRLHSCPSDHQTCVCGDTERCNQCPDHQYCLNSRPRVAASLTPAPVPPAPTV
jgi:hypothetical protein